MFALLIPEWGGKLLVENVNKFLERNNFKGLLFCKEKLITFYEKNNWIVIPADKVILDASVPEVYTMVYNCQSVDIIDYTDRLF